MRRWWKHLWSSEARQQGNQRANQPRPVEPLEGRQYLAGYTIAISDAAIYEGQSGQSTMVFTVSLSGISATGGASVRFSTQGDTAVAGQDYKATSGRLFFQAGQRTRTIAIPIYGDTTIEPHEQFFVNLSSPTNAGLARASGKGIIADDDAPIVTVTPHDPKAAEKKQEPGIFRISRTGSTAKPLKVFYMAAGSATKGADYTRLPGSVIIPARKSFIDISVIPIRDALVEGKETVTLRLKPRAGYQLGKPASAVVTIADAPKRKSAPKLAADSVLA